MSASSSLPPGTPSNCMPTSSVSGNRSRGSTRSSSASYSPKASSGSSVSASSKPGSLPARASSTLGNMPSNPPCRYARLASGCSSSSPSQSRRSYVRVTTVPASIRTAAVEGAADLQHLIDVRARVHVLQDMSHHALLVDHEGRARQASLGMPVDDLVLDNFVELAHLGLGVREQLHREAVLVAE